MRLRVATYNVRGLRGGVGPVGEVLAKNHPDVVCLQECGSRRSVGRLAAGLGMEVASTHRAFGRVRNAVLFALPWRESGLLVRELSREGRASPRGYVIVTLAAHGVRLAVGSVHLGLTARERRRHASELIDAVLEIGTLPPGGPVVLGADLNEDANGPAARSISGVLDDVYALVGEPPGNTFPAARPTDRIDFAFASPSLRVTGAWVATGEPASRASDHLPVVADIEIPG